MKNTALYTGWQRQDFLKVVLDYAATMRAAETDADAARYMLREVFKCTQARCENCDGEYWTGHATGRRSHAKFCTDRCRMAFARAKASAP